MSFFPTPPIYSGVDVNGNLTQVACLRKTRKGWEIIHLKTFSVNLSFGLSSSDSENFAPQIMGFSGEANGQRPFASTKNTGDASKVPEGEGEKPKTHVVSESVNLLDMGVVVSALSSRNTLVRSLELNLKKESDLKAALDFQIEPLLPYAIDQAIIQSQLIEKKSTGSVLTAFAVRQDHIHSHLDFLKQRGFEPEKVTCVPFALAALSTLFLQTDPTQFIVHEGEKEITCILVEQGKLLASRAFDRSCDLGVEIQKTLLSFSSMHKTKFFKTIFLLGKESESIQKVTEKPVLFPTIATLSLSQEELLRYGLAIGMAVATEEVNFRQKQFTYPHKWRRIKRPLLIAAALFTLFGGTLFTFGQTVVKQQKKTVESAYFSLFEAEGNGENTQPRPTTPHAFLSSLHQIEKEIRARPDTFPLLPGVPKVQELIVWLSSYPGIELDSLNYSMVKRPNFSYKKEHYKVRVDLEFAAKDTRVATAFHDALSESHLFIDTKEEIQWTTNKGKYRTSFYLKDKTRYSQ